MKCDTVSQVPAWRMVLWGVVAALAVLTLGWYSDLRIDYVPGTIEEEATRAFANLFAALKAAGFSTEEVTFLDIAFVDLADIGEVNKLYMRLFPEGRRPARTIYQAAALPFGGRVKVMGIAIREKSGG